MAVGNSKIRLTIPRQDLPAFTLFHPDAESAKNWTRKLPVARIHTVTELLHYALAELNRVKLAPEERFAILEALRPSIDNALASLAKRYLNQPLVMPEEPRQMAELCSELLSLSGTAYTVVAVEAIQRRDAIHTMNPARLACQSIQRAMFYQGRKVLQTFQLYRPLQMHGWQALHQLYALADSQQLVDLPVPEPLTGGKTIRAAYLQNLVLGCCKPNQLRQGDMAALYGTLREWVEMVELVEPGAGNGLFLVDLAGDQPPIYSSLYPTELHESCLLINTAALIEHLNQIKAGQSPDVMTSSNTSEKDDSLPEHLVDHLINSLGSMSMRNFKRTQSNAPLRVCLGLSSTHYHVAGGKDFHALLQGSAYLPQGADSAGGNPFLSHQAGDSWARANPEWDFVHNEWLPGQGDNDELEHSVDLDEKFRAELLEEVEVQLPLDQRYPVFKVQLADASPGGYCVEWTEELPGDVRTGDIVSLKEEQSKNWVIAVIRWLSRLENSRTLIGLELLSPRANAYGAVIHKSAGEKTPPMRVLLLPEIKLVGQPHTLLTPRHGFRERQRLTLVSGSEAHTVQLLRHVTSTPGYAQFEFRYIKELGDTLAGRAAGTLRSPYDSLWSNI